jgi:hypothetical protein
VNKESWDWKNRACVSMDSVAVILHRLSCMVIAAVVRNLKVNDVTGLDRQSLIVSMAYKHF